MHLIRLGDGTEESKRRMMEAVEELWRYTGEMFTPAEYENSFGIDISELRNPWLEKVTAVFDEAGLPVPQNVFMQTGGKQGKHTEYLGYLLTELQYMQRAFPGAEW